MDRESGGLSQLRRPWSEGQVPMSGARLPKAFPRRFCRPLSVHSRVAPPIYVQQPVTNASPNRNQVILQRRQRGASRREVAREFGLSIARIAAIEQEDAQAKALAARSARMEEEMRRANDLDKAWPVADLVEALGLPVIFRMRLLDHFGRGCKTQLSLRELFDLVVAPTAETSPGFRPIPLLQVWGVGKIGRRHVITALAGLDMGRRCNTAWRDHFARLAPSWLVAEMARSPGRTMEG